MIPPEKILIPHDDHRFDTIGHFADGRQYMAFVTGASPGSQRYPIKRWIAGIHIFDADGSHLNTDARLIGFAREEASLNLRAELLFDYIVAEYGIYKTQFRDIWIKLFSVTIDDIVYELVYKAEENGGHVHERATLWPDNIVFYPPWNDGYYDT